MDADVNNQFVKVTHGTFVFLTRNAINVVVQKSAQSINKHSFYLINKTGQEILEIVHGDMTINQIAKSFCISKKIVPEENTYWIKDYIMQLVSYGALALNDTPNFHKKIRVAGKDSLISPLSLTVELTDRCNLRCKHCYLNASAEKSKSMSFDQFSKLVTILKRNNVVNIELTGGEIFVNPDAYEILKLSFQNFAIVALLTNGTILDDKILNLLIEHKNKVVVNISIDSVNESVHDEFRGVAGAFKRTCENMKRMTDNGIIVRMASAIFSANLWEIDKLAKLSRSLGAAQFTFNHVEGFGRGTDLSKLNFNNDEKALKYVKYINDVIAANRDIIPIVSQDDYLLGTKNCGAGIKKIVIDPDGMLRPCVLYPSSLDFGNIFEQDYLTIFQKKIFTDLSEVTAPGKESGCDVNCIFLNHCKGCYVKALEHNTSFDIPCNWILKNNLQWLLQLYSRR